MHRSRPCRTTRQPNRMRIDLPFPRDIGHLRPLHLAHGPTHVDDTSVPLNTDVEIES